MRKQSRTVEIMADAAYHILSKDSRSFTGNFVIDEHILRDECGVTDFDKYSVVPGTKEFMMDFFIDEVENDQAAKNLEVASKANAQKAAPAATAASENDVSASMNAMKGIITPDLVGKVKDNLCPFSYQFPEEEPTCYTFANSIHPMYLYGVLCVWKTYLRNQANLVTIKANIVILTCTLSV